MAAAYTSPSAIKARMGVTDTNNDAEFTAVATAVNDMVEDWLGFAAAPGGTAVRTYDGDGSAELLVRGGVQGIATLEISDGTTFTATTSYVIRPQPFERPTGWPGWRVILTDGETFTAGYDTVRITPATATGWGFAAIPPMLARIADIAGVRMFQARQSGEMMTVGSPELGTSLVRFLPEPEYTAYLDHLAYALGGRRRAG